MSTPPRLGPNPARVFWPDYGAQVLTSLSPNRVAEVKPLRWHRLAVHFRDDAGYLAGHAQLWLLQCSCPMPESRCVEAMVQLDDYDFKAGVFAERLLETCANAPAMLTAGMSMAEFAWLEVHPGRVRPGTGLALGRELMAMAARRYRCVAFLFRPFDLQYDLVLGRPRPESRRASWVSMERANLRLARAYSYRWAARPLSEHSLWLVCSTQHGGVRRDARGRWEVPVMTDDYCTRRLRAAPLYVH